MVSYMIFCLYMISYMTFDFPSVRKNDSVVTGVEARVVEPQLPAASDNDSDRSSDSGMQIDFLIWNLDDLDSPGRIND